jgi:Mn-dependent DtxR family transcriptional regulator
MGDGRPGKGVRAMATPTQEDYLKTIWRLIQRKGYARVSDIADALALSHASVSRMVRRLHADGLATYEPYRGLNLTALGRQRGRLLVERQRILRAWLEQMGVPAGDEFERTVEGIEHHFGPAALARVDRLVRFAAGHAAWWREFEAWEDPGPARRRPPPGRSRSRSATARGGEGDEDEGGEDVQAQEPEDHA